MGEMKTAILIISDPENGDEALARLFNALILAHESKSKSDAVEVAFIGTGTRWPERLAQLGHPANALYDSVRELVVGASRACATHWKTADAVTAAGLPLIADNSVLGSSGGVSIHRYLADDWRTLVF
jgi:hypothetical protein